MVNSQVNSYQRLTLTHFGMHQIYTVSQLMLAYIDKLLTSFDGWGISIKSPRVG